jgi:FecR protein
MVPYSRRALSVAVLAAFSGFGAYAQSVVSAHSGVLHVSEGAVFANDQPVNQKYGTFPDLKEKSVLRTEAGRAEVLLTPGVFLRIGENSAIKMIDNRLSDTRVELLKGTAMVECDDPMKENSVTMIYGDFQVHVRKTAVMEFASNPAELKVFHGEAEVELNGTVSVVKAGKALPFTQALAQEHFDAKTSGDELTRWSEERSEAVAVANVSAAKSLRDSSTGQFGFSGFGPGGMGGIGGAAMPYGSWYYNPYYSMYTYMPMNGMFFNPYGYGFFSPYSVYQIYNNPGYFYGGSGGGAITQGTPTSSSNRPRPISTNIGNARTGQQAGYGLGRNGGTATPVGYGNSGGVSNGLSSVASPASSMGGSGSSGRAGSGARGK